MLGCQRTRPVLRDHKTPYRSGPLPLLSAAAELVNVLPERGRDQLDRFGHCRKYVHRVDDVVYRQFVLDCENCLVDHIRSVVCEDVNSQYPSSRGLSNHFDQPSSVSDYDGLWHLRYWYGSARALIALLMGLLLSEAD